jgi:8-oxo-dGTP diphosphatase
MPIERRGTLKKVQVVCAVIVFERRVLAVKRGSQMKMPGKWEFPGGKMETGETPVQAIVREIREELDMHISVLDAWSAVWHDYGDFQIELMPFLCTTTDPQPVLTEHESFQWLDQNSLFDPDWAEADLPVRDRVAMWLVNN